MTLRQAQPLLCFFGHHKCGTQWIQGILREVCQDMGLKYGVAFNDKKFNDNLDTFINERKINFFSYTNAQYKDIKPLENFKGFHVIRDPRDIIVSAYFSHLYSHPTEQYPLLQEEREKLQKLSKEEGLFQEIDYNQKVLQAMYEWDYLSPHILEVKMEELMTYPYEKFIDIFAHLGILNDSPPTIKARSLYILNLAAKRIQGLLLKKNWVSLRLDTIPLDRGLGIVYKNSFKKKTKGRKPGEENIKSHYRKGVAGDWKNHFQPEHIDYFKKNYGDLLIKLGYEENNQW